MEALAIAAYEDEAAAAKYMPEVTSYLEGWRRDSEPAIKRQFFFEPFSNIQSKLISRLFELPAGVRRQAFT